MEVKKHWCRYYLVKKSFKSIGNIQSWIERCKCSRLVKVSIVRRETENKVEEIVTKHWFDSEGKLEKVTQS